MTKVCTRCNRELSVDNFHKNCKTKDGLQAWCKDCRKVSRQVRHKKRTHDNIVKDLHKLKYQKDRKGLQYAFIGRKKNGKHRQLRFKCLHCGTIVETSLKTAIENKFLCEECKFINKKTNEYIKKPFRENIKLKEMPEFKVGSLTFPSPTTIRKKDISDNPFRKIWNKVVDNIVRRNKEKQVSLDISKIKNINFADGKMVVTLGEDLHPQMQNSKR